MRRFLMVSVVAAAMVIAGTPQASAEMTADRVARQQAEIRARIACQRDPASCRPQRTTRAASAATKAPAADSRGGGGRSIEISVGAQELRAYEGSRLVMAFPVS